jgi:predicted nucleic-acid-binding Zn-ribbon protein
MYDGWKKNGAHIDEWWKKTNDFIERAFSLATTPKIRCPCVKCQNTRYFDKVILTKHLVKNGFAIDYETWVFHGEKYTTITAEEFANDRVGANRMDEMLEAIRPEFDMDTDDSRTPVAEEFFRLLKPSKELL